MKDGLDCDCGICSICSPSIKPSKLHCTQCESKKENPWCSNCIEKDCLIELEGTCEMIRKYLQYNKILEANDILRRRYNEMPNVRQTRTARVRENVLCCEWSCDNVV